MKQKMKKLSLTQAKVIKLMQEGWELGSDVFRIGHTVETEIGRLQKYGLGHGDPCESVKIQTINALVKKGLIEALPNLYVGIQPTVYKLTQKGREVEENAKKLN